MPHAIHTSFQALSAPGKRLFLERLLKGRKWDVIANVVRETCAVEEGFLFALPQQVLGILGGDSRWALAKLRAVESFCAASSKDKADRIAHAMDLGQRDFLAALVYSTDCVEQGYLCERQSGPLDVELEEKRSLAVQKALAVFRGLSDWQKVCRIREAVELRQWGFLRELILHTDCVIEGFLWDPPPAVIPAEGINLHEGVESGAASRQRDPSEVERVWRAGVRVWRERFFGAAAREQSFILERLTVLSQWRPVADVLGGSFRGAFDRSGRPEKKVFGSAATLRPEPGFWMSALRFIGPSLASDEEVVEAWSAALCRWALQGADDCSRVSPAEAFAYRVQVARADANEWLRRPPTSRDVANPERGFLSCPQEEAVVLSARSSGFRIALRGLERVPPQKIPERLRIDPEVVLGEWRGTWGLSGESLPGNWRTFRSHTPLAGLWPEGTSWDFPEARAEWAWAWMRRLASSRLEETPQVPSQLRHIPQIFRLVSGWLLERLDTPINRMGGRFPDPAPHADLLLSAGLWDALGHRCAALAEWVYGEAMEIRRIPALLRNHARILELCSRGRVVLESSTTADEASLVRFIVKEPVPWCLIPAALRANEAVRKAFCSGWSRHAARALPLEVVPEEARLWDASIFTRWLRAWRTLVANECTPRYVVPDRAWNADGVLRRKMWERWFEIHGGGEPSVAPASDRQLEGWYAAWSGDWILLPRSHGRLQRGSGKCRTSVVRAGKFRVKLVHPDETARREALHWHGEFEGGGRSLLLLPVRLYHVSDVLEAWVGGSVAAWKRRVEAGALDAEGLLQEVSRVPTLWQHCFWKRPSLRKTLTAIWKQVCSGAGAPAVEISRIPLWLGAHADWEALTARGFVRLPDTFLNASSAEKLRWLRENPLAPCVLRAAGTVCSESVLQACREGWLIALRQRAFPVEALPDFPGPQVLAADGAPWWKDAVSEGWFRDVSDGNVLFPWDCFPEVLRDSDHSPEPEDASLIGESVQTAFERAWLRRAQSEEWLCVANESGNIEGQLEPKAVRELFGRWRRAWSFSISNQLGKVRRSGFQGYSLKQVEAKVWAGIERAVAITAGTGADVTPLLADGCFREALFASWVWVSGAAVARLTHAPSFLENAQLREHHLEGWRRVLETRAWAQEKIPPYVLQHGFVREAWRRGWCARLTAEAVPASVLPPELHWDGNIRAAWINGWEVELLAKPRSAWEIPPEIRTEERIRTVWKEGWIRRFDSREESPDLAILVGHIFAPEGIPLHRRLWIVSVAGGGEPNALGVPPGYEAVEAEVERSARGWAEWHLSHWEWEDASRLGVEWTPEFFVFLCAQDRNVPAWESLPATLRRKPRVQEAWMKRHGLAKKWAYELGKLHGGPGPAAGGGLKSALEALFDRPWAVEEVPESVRAAEAVQRAVREGWEEKIRSDAAYRELFEAVCTGPEA